MALARGLGIAAAALIASLLALLALPIETWRTGDQGLQRLSYQAATPSDLPARLWIDTDAACAQVVCRSTIRSRDRRTEQVSLPLDEGGLAHLAAWFETMLLSFGQQYFEPA